MHMRRLAAILFLGLSQPVSAQQLNLTSLQHELRWLDESRFQPFVKDPVISDSLLEYAAAALAHKFNTATYSRPEQISYRVINMFGKPKIKPPGEGTNEKDYQVSMLSLLTRATTGFEVFWQMKVEVSQKGKIVYQRETNHELLNYEASATWFDGDSFLEHFKVLIDELLELRPPLAQKYVLGTGIDYAQVLRTDGYAWKVDKNSTPIGFGRPAFGPYTTLDAGRQDTAVIRTSTYRGKESSVGADGSRLFFDQFKTYEVSKTKFAFLRLGKGSDTLEATYAVLVQGVESRRTFLSNLLSNNDEVGSNGSGSYRRNVEGNIRIDSLTWSFLIEGYGSDGTITGGHLENGRDYFRLFYRQHAGYHWEMIMQSEEGEFIASLEFRTSGTELHLLKKLPPEAADAIAALYAVLLSARNVQ
jgi:hypothetical protein